MKNEDKETLKKALTDRKLVSERLKRILLRKIGELKVHGEASMHGESETPALIQAISSIYNEAGVEGLASFALILIEALIDFVIENNHYIVGILDTQNDEALKD